MKKDDLKKALIRLIREEVRKAVTDEVNKAMGRILVEMVKEVKKVPTASPPISEEEMIRQSPIKTNNPKLTSVLAETAMNFKPLQKQAGSLAELMDGGFDKIGENEASYNNDNTQAPPDNTRVGFLKKIVSEGFTPQRSVIDSPDVPDTLKGVFKKDFRAVMRAIDERKKGGGGFGIDPRTVLSG